MNDVTWDHVACTSTRPHRAQSLVSKVAGYVADYVFGPKETHNEITLQKYLNENYLKVFY